MLRSGLLVVLASLTVAACSGTSGDDVPPGADPTAQESGIEDAPPPAASGETDAPPPAATTGDGGATPVAPPGGPGGTLRVMSYNIKTGSESSLAAVAAAIAAETPDLVGLQEVDDVTNRSGKVHQTDQLATLTGYPYRYFGKNFDFDGGAYGLAILSKLPLVSPHVVRMDTHTDRANGYEPRIAVIADVTAFGKSITFVTMHASLHDEERAGNAQRVLTALGTSRKPTIITGDMNETPGQAIGQTFTGKGLVDAHHQKTSNPLAGWTAPSSFPLRRIDFVYKDAAFGPTRYSWVPGTKASDHRPVMVTFDTP